MLDTCSLNFVRVFKTCNQDILKTIIARSYRLDKLIKDDEQKICKLAKLVYQFIAELLPLIHS